MVCMCHAYNNCVIWFPALPFELLTHQTQLSEEKKKNVNDLSLSIRLQHESVGFWLGLTWINAALSHVNLFVCLSTHSTVCKAHLGGQQISQSKHWRSCALLRVSLSPSVSQLWDVSLAKEEDFSSPTDVPQCENINCSVPDHLFKLMFWYLNASRDAKSVVLLMYEMHLLNWVKTLIHPGHI